MKERGILFSGEMVRAILAGKKTQTRRAVKPTSFILDVEKFGAAAQNASWLAGLTHQACPYGQPGDRLWVRETYGLHRYVDYTDWHKESVRGATSDLLDEWAVAYRADAESDGAHWRPSIFMPRWASRITLDVTSVRVRRLHDISEADAIAEGCASVAEYRELWDRINGAGSWAQNPWVWVVTFRRVEP